MEFNGELAILQGSLLYSETIFQKSGKTLLEFTRNDDESTTKILNALCNTINEICAGTRYDLSPEQAAQTKMILVSTLTAQSYNTKFGIHCDWPDAMDAELCNHFDVMIHQMSKFNFSLCFSLINMTELTPFFLQMLDYVKHEEGLQLLSEFVQYLRQNITRDYKNLLYVLKYLFIYQNPYLFLSSSGVQYGVGKLILCADSSVSSNLTIDDVVIDILNIICDWSSQVDLTDVFSSDQQNILTFCLLNAMKVTRVQSLGDWEFVVGVTQCPKLMIDWIFTGSFVKGMNANRVSYQQRTAQQKVKPYQSVQLCQSVKCGSELHRSVMSLLDRLLEALDVESILMNCFQSYETEGVKSFFNFPFSPLLVTHFLSIVKQLHIKVESLLVQAHLPTQSCENGGEWYQREALYNITNKYYAYKEFRDWILNQEFYYNNELFECLSMNQYCLQDVRVVKRLIQHLYRVVNEDNYYRKLKKLIFSVFDQLSLPSQLSLIEFVNDGFNANVLFKIDSNFTQDLTLVFNRVAAAQSNTTSVLTDICRLALQNTSLTINRLVAEAIHSKGQAGILGKITTELSSICLSKNNDKMSYLFTALHSVITASSSSTSSLTSSPKLQQHLLTFISTLLDCSQSTQQPPLDCVEFMKHTLMPNMNVGNVTLQDRESRSLANLSLMVDVTKLILKLNPQTLHDLHTSDLGALLWSQCEILDYCITQCMSDLTCTNVYAVKENASGIVEDVCQHVRQYADQKEEYSTMCCWLQVNLQKLHWCLQFYLLPLNEIFHLPILLPESVAPFVQFNKSKFPATFTPNIKGNFLHFLMCLTATTKQAVDWLIEVIDTSKLIGAKISSNIWLAAMVQVSILSTQQEWLYLCQFVMFSVRNKLIHTTENGSGDLSIIMDILFKMMYIVGHQNQNEESVSYKGHICSLYTASIKELVLSELPTVGSAVQLNILTEQFQQTCLLQSVIEIVDYNPLLVLSLDILSTLETLTQHSGTNDRKKLVKCLHNSAKCCLLKDRDVLEKKITTLTL